jgi:hypothetical protein
VGFITIFCVHVAWPAHDFLLSSATIYPEASSSGSPAFTDVRGGGGGAPEQTTLIFYFREREIVKLQVGISSINCEHLQLHVRICPYVDLCLAYVAWAESSRRI